jgi:hypothetical protein
LRERTFGQTLDTTIFWGIGKMDGNHDLGQIVGQTPEIIFVCFQCVNGCLDTLGQSLDTVLSNGDILGQTGHTLRGVLMSKVLTTGLGIDMKLEDKLKNVHSLEELYGFANRRKVLGVDLPKWTEEERRLILARKYELEKANVK